MCAILQAEEGTGWPNACNTCSGAGQCRCSCGYRETRAKDRSSYRVVGEVKLYFAGNVTTAEQEPSLCKDAGIQYRLLSFADIDSWGKDAFAFWTSPQAPMPFFLDSGAFGALTRGAMIDLNRYSAYIKEHETSLYPYACLDVIGDWYGSAVNYDIMRSKGLNPLPTFHMTQDGFHE